MGSNHLINEPLAVEAQAKDRHPQHNLTFDGHLVLPQGVIERIE